MLGNWSLGEYFKSEQIPLFWHFLTEIVGLDPNRIYVTVFSGDPGHGIPRDDESADIWTELFTKAGVSSDRVMLLTEQQGQRARKPGRADRVLQRQELVVAVRWYGHDTRRRPWRTGQRGLLLLPTGGARQGFRQVPASELRWRAVHGDR